MIGRLIRRDLRRTIGGSALLPILFFLLVAALVPFAVGPDAKLLARVGPGLMWVAALAAALLPIERLVEPDRAAGVLDQLALGGLRMEEVALAKIVAHWLSFGPPLLVAAVPASVLLGMPAEALWRTLVTLAVGTPALAALAVAVASLTAGLRQSSALGGLLLMPLAIPLLIFAASAAGDPRAGALQLEAAVSLFLVAGSPFIAGAALRAART
ncbi:heme exporter protein CcmB [Sphingomonas sp. LHG3406-1]|uniref:heme exporter protein CcmB n=1 Tax=Sphingomonas sp. LHG3406-1 TaxID=2804617 RepID=UPI00262A1B47|nr:heme exporter protein CcmB [Sphingomonas sp. LHG3406-1]